jgi:cell division protein FtsW (lipid II flippase)
MATLALPVIGVCCCLYGGALLLSLFIGIGMLVNAQAHRKLAHS